MPLRSQHSKTHQRLLAGDDLTSQGYVLPTSLRGAADKQDNDATCQNCHNVPTIAAAHVPVVTPSIRPKGSYPPKLERRPLPPV